ncbi:hypothetical protein OG783_22810 [Streptomyces jietaisiensis]|uniref:hypothetical protein n=1 Tax=Streptomyces griseoaurantiacus TaxID=68213 RepID=UPI003250CA56
MDAVQGFFSFLSDPIGTIVGVIASTILAAAIFVFHALIVGVPTLTGVTTAKDINGQTQWLVVYLAVGSLLFAAARMAVERRSTAGTTALKGMARVIVVSGAATTIVLAAASVADDYSTHLFNAGAQNVLRQVGGCSSPKGIQAFLLLIVAFLLLIAGIIQTILMYIRLGVMILLLGTLPLAAAASMTDWGGGWWRKHLGWMIAWLLYKPAAGLVLYAGTVMISQGQVRSYTNAQGEVIPYSNPEIAANERIAGIALLLLSAVALPALLKLVVPATAALGGASAHSEAMQSVGGGLATGARSIGGGSGSDSGSGRSDPGRSGPSGASGASGGGGSSGASGTKGAAGTSGGGGRMGPGRPGGGSAGAGGGSAGAGAASGAGGGAAAAGGPAGAAVAAAVQTAQVLGRAASGALNDADGDLGHNGSHHNR